MALGDLQPCCAADRCWVCVGRALRDWLIAKAPGSTVIARAKFTVKQEWVLRGGTELAPCPVAHESADHSHFGRRMVCQKRLPTRSNTTLDGDVCGGRGFSRCGASQALTPLRCRGVNSKGLLLWRRGSCGATPETSRSWLPPGAGDLTRVAWHEPGSPVCRTSWATLLRS